MEVQKGYRKYDHPNTYAADPLDMKCKAAVMNTNSGSQLYNWWMHCVNFRGERCEVCENFVNIVTEKGS